MPPREHEDGHDHEKGRRGHDDLDEPSTIHTFISTESNITLTGSVRPQSGDQGRPGPARYLPGSLAEVAPVRGNDEQHTSERECDTGDDRSRSRYLEGWDLGGDEPDTGEQNKEEADLGNRHSRLMAQRKHGGRGSDIDCSDSPTTNGGGTRPVGEGRGLASCREVPKLAPRRGSESRERT